MYQLSHIQTSPASILKSEIEHKTTFSLNKCELNIFETVKQAENVRLTFDGFTITSMLRGKKVIHNTDSTSFGYIPGETLMLDANAEMVIDFPEASYSKPSQCTAMVIDNAYLQRQLDYINELFPRDNELNNEWNFNSQCMFLRNDNQVARLSDQLIRIFSGTDPMKDLLVDIKLKELVLSIMRLQNRNMVEGKSHRNERFKAVVDYIRNNITANISAMQLSKVAYMSKSVFYRTFANEFGISPNTMILKEKIRYAKTLMAHGNPMVRSICYESGFSDPNYFARVFKKIEGITPTEYIARLNNGTG